MRDGVHLHADHYAPLTDQPLGTILVRCPYGRGFPFSGTMALPELDSGRKGPIVIKDRVRAIGGQLVIESMPNQGTRLRVLVPQEAYV